MRLFAISCSAVLAITGCAVSPSVSLPATEVAAFSSNWAGRGTPAGWQPWLINRSKAPTRYERVVDPVRDQVVLHAMADKAASGLAQSLDVDPVQRPRLVLFFDGDKNTLPFKEQVLIDAAKMLTGQDVPYATLVYVWENQPPVGTVIPNAHARQVKMAVAGSGAERVGQWQCFERDYVADYRKAFGTDPGRLVGVGILTDTDNTGASTEAWYGDIELLPPRQAAANGLRTGARG